MKTENNAVAVIMLKQLKQKKGELQAKMRELEDRQRLANQNRSMFSGRQSMIMPGGKNFGASFPFSDPPSVMPGFGFKRFSTF
jgi:hypothetical protein